MNVGQTEKRVFLGGGGVSLLYSLHFPRQDPFQFLLVFSAPLRDRFWLLDVRLSSSPEKQHGI